MDRLVLLKEDGNARRNSEQEHERALERLERLQRVCGGLYFGGSIDHQLAVMAPATGRTAKPPWDVLRFSCTPEVYQLIREEPHRFPPEHTAHAALPPNPAGDSHPHPVEIRLPSWTIQHDWDLRNWLFRWGAGIRIEHPQDLREKQLEQAREVLALLGGSQRQN